MSHSLTVGDLLKSLAPKTSPPSAPLYQSYLLRLWRDTPTGQWRATLEQVSTGKTYSFARLESLIDFLNDPTQVTNSTHPDSGSGDTAPAGEPATPTAAEDDTPR